MSGEVIRIPTDSGRDLHGCVALPEAGSGPGLLLFDENGTDEEARQLADLYAAEGYAVLCAAVELENDVAAAVAGLRQRRECTGKMAAIGFGQGGLTALRTATRKGVECVICYYPPSLAAALEFAAKIACPVMLHFAGDPAVPEGKVAAIQQTFASRTELLIFYYPGVKPGFERKGGAHFDKAAAGLAHSRSLALLRRLMGPYYDLEALWEAHTRYEFETRDVAATMATMVDEPYVNHVPTMTGGVGQRDLARFYANHFIPKLPRDTRLVPISRTVGADCVVDEMLFCFTHNTEIDFMLPGVPPTGRYVEVPTVAIVKFRGDKLYHEHIYWDQASVLVQIGLLDPKGLPVAGTEAAKKLIDETRPSNTLMNRWAQSASRADE